MGDVYAVVVAFSTSAKMPQITAWESVPQRVLPKVADVGGV